MWDRVTQHTPRILPALFAPLWLTGAIIGAVTGALIQTIRWAAAAVQVGFTDGARNRVPKVEPGVIVEWATLAALIVLVVVVW